MNVFGSPEYGLKTKPDMTYPYRVVPKYDLGDDSEVSPLTSSRPVDSHGQAKQSIDPHTPLVSVDLVQILANVDVVDQDRSPVGISKR